MIRIALRYLSLLLIILLVVGFTKIFDTIINFSTSYFSSDNELHPYTLFNIKAALVLLVFFLGIIFLLSFSKVSQSVLNFFYRFIDIGRIKSFLLTDDLNPGKKLTGIILTASFLIGSGIHFSLLLIGQPEKEGWLENITTALFLVAAIFSLAAIFQIRMNHNLIGSWGRTAQVMLGLFTVALVGIFGEEISWGQHMFQWNSGDVFAEANFQNETNLHNFFNPFFKYAYPIFGICFFIAIFSLWFFPNISTINRESFYNQLFIPHPSLFYLVTLITATSIIAVHETFEALLAFFVFFYFFRIYYSTRKKAILVNCRKP